MVRSKSCRPSPGQTFLAIGQDLFSIQEYVTEQWNASIHRTASTGSADASLSSFTPAAVMVYSDIQTLRGLDHPVDYGSGVEFADGLLNDIFVHQSLGLQLGLWLNGTQGCLDIISGKLDSNLMRLFQYIEKSRASVVFLRLGYEFDNPWFGYSDQPQVYQAAFRTVVQYCRKHHHWCRGNRKIQFVWHSWAAPRLASLEDFYPGNAFVDWMGISLFQQWYPWSTESGSAADVEQVLEFAKQHDMPVMIAESTPFGGIEWNVSEVQQKHNYSSVPSSLQDPWQRWFQPTLDLIDKYDISMWSYINCAWDSQPMWKGVGFGETRLSTSAEVMDQWKRFVLDNPRFLTAGSMVDCQKYDISSVGVEVDTSVNTLPYAATSPIGKFRLLTTRWDTGFFVVVAVIGAASLRYRRRSISGQQTSTETLSLVTTLKDYGSVRN